MINLPKFSITACISFKTGPASPCFEDHRFPLSKYRNSDSNTRLVVVTSLPSLAILLRQTLDQKAGFLASSLPKKKMSYNLMGYGSLKYPNPKPKFESVFFLKRKNPINYLFFLGVLGMA